MEIIKSSGDGQDVFGPRHLKKRSHKMQIYRGLHFVTVALEI
ncbi:hypothetical protein HRM2_p00450 (plasmid) [Desulforapulum autotrophicum HRM2]|uniref:Uncharacterized protein n=1 Tax=Desulforapulum autotrophicum (strain ATCC 43914 / DSM 3382 / VKM B-1955 / HRM2) TaxID=177437 RepID=C0QMP5_DESAH|nr:hypothetical protein HRM2_p00450 [Desulforapulum autotrophicum HRM2]